MALSHPRLGYGSCFETWSWVDSSALVINLQTVGFVVCSRTCSNLTNHSRFRMHIFRTFFLIFCCLHVDFPFRVQKVLASVCDVTAYKRGLRTAYFWPFWGRLYAIFPASVCIQTCVFPSFFVGFMCNFFLNSKNL